ncbi:MAG: thiamine phosphate synthase [Hyphomonadaceae bacterium]|nr:thiamine phosphate synthase [Hyphomonadaceae bacterium]
MSRAVLASIARRLNREFGRRAGGPALPPLLFLTDPARTPDPVAVAARLPPGAGVIYRHFGAEDRFAVAFRLRKVTRARGGMLLIGGGDFELARKVRADGVSVPERLMRTRPAWSGLVLAAAHSRAALARAKALGMGGALLSPVFPSRSPSAGRPLGALKAGLLARQAGMPVYALGGVNHRTAARLIGRGFAGLAAVDALKD